MKYRYKKNIKYLEGTQALNFAPDYSNLYNAQDSVYNRRTKQSSIDGSIQPIASNLLDNSKLSGGAKNGIQVGSTVANVASNVIEQSSYKSDGMQDVGGAVASNSLKYGAMGASMGSAIMPGWGTAIGGAIGVVGGGIYGGITATKNNQKIQLAKQQDDFINSKNKGAINNYKYNLQGNINTDVAQTQGFAKKGKYKLKTETRVSHNSPDDSKASKEMIKNYKKSDPNKYKLRTNKSVIVKTFK